MPYELVQDHVSPDVVEAAQQIAEGAKSGVVIGMGTVILLKKKRYFVSFTGEAARDPTFMRGAVQAMDDELKDMLAARSESATTR